jgi:putative phosphoribosyl transferase
MAEESEVIIQAGHETLRGILTIPKGAKAIVLFAHGSGSGRLSPRNQFVAKKLQEASLATLLLDLLTDEEERIDVRTAQFRFDIDLLTERLEQATGWVKREASTKALKVAYFGASTGAAAALLAASELGTDIACVVSRGGRPDLAQDALLEVKAPTLLIVGSNDSGVIELNQKALDELTCEKKMILVKGATHLFEEPGTLEQVADYAANWFQTHL